MSTRAVVAVTGVAIVMAYAALMAVESLVLDPLAAVPGQSLAQIHAHLTHEGMDVAADISSVLTFSAIGVLLALAVAFFGLLVRAPVAGLVIAFLSLLGLGAVAAFRNGFALGMDVADAYGTSGGAHTIWPGVLYITSVAALVAIPVVAIVAARRNRQLRACLA